MARLVRHSQRKRGATDRPDLTPPRQTSTLPTVKILELMGKRAKEQALAEESVEDPAQKTRERSGLFTSGIVSTGEGRRITLFFSGRQHAGENLKDVLIERAAERAPPIQMCDALARNLPAELETIVAHCLVSVAA